MSDLADRARQRIRDEMAKRHLSQQDVADLIKWTQSRVAQKITGRTPITLDELEALAFAVALAPVEIIRDRGMEFFAEMAPYELRVLEKLRELPKHVREAYLEVLSVKASEEKHAAPKKPLFGKPRAR